MEAAHIRERTGPDRNSRRPALRAGLRLALDERALDHVLAALVAAPLAEAARLEQGHEIAQHAGTAADHDAVVLGIEGRQAEIRRQLAAVEQGREPPLVAERLARDGRVVRELRRRLLADQLVLRQRLLEERPVAE